MSTERLSSVFVASISHIINESGEREVHSTPAWPLIQYFSKRCERLVIVELPLPRKGMYFKPQAVLYSKGQFIERRVLPTIMSWPFRINDRAIESRTYFKLKIRDIVAVMWFMLVYRQRYELFIGVESLAAILGVIFKKLGLVKRTAYYISDWAPVKYKNRLVNWIYIKMDWWACRFNDFIWNYTYAISDARRDILKYRMDRIGKELWVPFGFIPQGVTHLQDKDIDRRSMIYCGGMGPEYGVGLIIDSLPLIKQKIPDIKIDILGDGPDMGTIKAKARQLGVDSSISWRGYVSDRENILSYYLKASLSLAPFAPLENSVKKYGDVIKIRESIGCGVPVITTQVPPSHKEILEKGIGEIIEYTPESLAQSVIRLMTDDVYYFTMRHRVIDASRDYLWENIYTRTLEAMGYATAPLYSQGN